MQQTISKTKKPHRIQLVSVGCGGGNLELTRQNKKKGLHINPQIPFVLRSAINNLHQFTYSYFLNSLREHSNA